MTPMMLIIALALLPPEPITVEPWIYDDTIRDPYQIIESDGYTTSTEAAE